MSFDRTMSSRRFKVALRPRLSAITEHPKMDFADYERRLTSLQGVLQLTQQAYLGTPERAIIVLEGSDTSGKGGIVRRLGWALDPRSFRVSPVASPDEHERAQHYLQRFWRRLPEQGQIVVFDRSWYGRVLVERIEGFATETEWRRAYREPAMTWSPQRPASPPSSPSRAMKFLIKAGSSWDVITRAPSDDSFSSPGPEPCLNT